MKRARLGAAAAALLVATGLSAAARAQAQKPDPAPARPSDNDIFGAPAQPDKAPDQEPKQAPNKDTDQNPNQKPDSDKKPAADQKAAEGEPRSDAQPTDDRASKPLPPGAPAAAAAAQPPADLTKDSAVTAPPSTRESSRDEALLGTPDEATRLSQDVAPEDPLKIGGLFYLRTQSSGKQGQDPQNWSLSAPSLLDAYMDARPNDRVRGFVLARMQFDPTLPPNGTVTTSTGIGGVSQTGGTDLSSIFGTATRGPTVALDQMWLRFDMKHTVFVTAGKQHVRWGTARFWTPTDFLHIKKRNPLDVFDARTGTTMVKLHFPWEQRGWNFYTYALLEDAVAKPTVGNIAGAARAEIVLGTTEIGAGALVQDGRKPKLAADVSTGIWDFDIYGELALRYGSEIDRVRYAGDTAMVPSNATLTQAVDELYPVIHRSGIKPQAVGGVTYSHKYNDNDVWNLGIEYFYNALGYDSPQVYPGLVLPHSTPLNEPASFFYLGRQYGALFLNIPAPYSWNYTSFTLSTLGNFSDQSFITRLDYALVLLTHLQFEAFAAVHYGTREGEFRFGISNFVVGGVPYNSPPGLIDLGVALRVSI